MKAGDTVAIEAEGGRVPVHRENEGEPAGVVRENFMVKQLEKRRILYYN